MANPSSHSARTVAALTDVALEGLPLTSVDRIEAELLAEVCEEDGAFGAWVLGERGPA